MPAAIARRVPILQLSVDMFLEGLFWTGLFGTVYPYVAFPALMRLRTRLTSPCEPLAVDGTDAPILTVVIPAYNEEASIAAKIRNTLATAYPRHLLEVVVVSDGSTDGTNRIAQSFERDGVRVIVQDTRGGKSAGLNRAVASGRGDILVFTDANASFGPETLERLVRHFTSPAVGLVTGYTRYRLTASGDVAEMTNAYTLMERVIKRGESRSGKCVGADGAVFAMRRVLYRPLREDDINDFVLPLSVIDQKFRCVFADDVFCSENAGADLETEFRRQSRITNRTLRALWRHTHLLNPLRFPVFAFFLFSHKIARFLVPFCLALSGSALLLLAPGRWSYLTAAIAAFAILAAAPFWRCLPHRSAPGRLLRLVQSFVIVNIAVVDGWSRFLIGRRDVTWQPHRSSMTE
jgi:cellulose synthase/poly-beta-1,6-N-acetylglucosamine synthase-like glycosyltransferase